MAKYQAFGTLTLEVSKLLDALDDKEAIEKLVSKFNTYGIRSISIQLELENNEIHELEVHDHDMEWNSVDEEEATKHMA